MDEKTEELRDLFVDVAGTDTVTDDQAVDRGTLSERDEATVQAQLRAIVERMREAFGFETDLDVDRRVQLVRAFYRGEDDATIAAELSTDVETARRARLDVHLFRESDTDGPRDWPHIRSRLEEADDETVAETLALDPDRVRWLRRVRRAREQARRVSHRYRSAFRDVIPDADLADRLTDGMTEDGLTEAAADIETDVSF